MWWQRPQQSQVLSQLLWPTVFAGAALCLLFGLGFWQLERLSWKEALLARLAARAGAEPMALAAVERRWRQGEDVEYLHAVAKGRFHNDKELYLFAPTPAGLGWHVYTPLEIAPGRILWVNRGWVDDAHKRPEQRPAGQIEGDPEVRGLIRATSPPGLFTPSNDAAANLWYWPDLAHMTRAAYGAAPPPALAFRLELDQQPAPPGGLPRGGITRLDLPNRHLEYAVTCFALGLTLIVVYFAFVRHRLRSGQSKPAAERAGHGRGAG
jgi:surfeit locus 1 family protein